MTNYVAYLACHRNYLKQLSVSHIYTIIVAINIAE